MHIPSYLSNKSCTFGKGNKQYQTKDELKKAELIPAPGHYDILSASPKFIRKRA